MYIDAGAAKRQRSQLRRSRHMFRSNAFSQLCFTNTPQQCADRLPVSRRMYLQCAAHPQHSSTVIRKSPAHELCMSPHASRLASARIYLRRR
jgi:hypothetical protein